MRHFARAAFPALLALALSQAPTRAAGPQGAVARANVTPGEITWNTRVEADRWLLTVSGQGIYLRQIFEDRQTPALNSVAPDRERLPDGSYNWELRALQPAAAESSRELLKLPTRTRQAPDRAKRFERRVVRRPIVASGSFRVTNGAFVMPGGLEVGRVGREQPF